MKVDSAKLIECFNLVDSVPTSTILESSQFVSVEAKSGKLKLRLSGIASAQAQMDCEGEASFLADRRALGAFLKRVKETITCESTDKTTLLRSGSSKLEIIQPKEVGGYTIWKAGKGLKLKLEGNLLSLLSEYAKANPGEPHLEVVCFRKGFGAFATDTISVAACLDKTISSDCFLPKLIATLFGELQVEDLWVESAGAAIQNEVGWVYQPLPASETTYPVDQVRGILEGLAKEKGFLTISAAALLEALQPLRDYTWASDGIMNIQCIPAKKLSDVLRLRLDTPGVKVEFPVNIKVTGAMPEKWIWHLERVLPWLEHMASLEEAMLVIGIQDHLKWFRCLEGKAGIHYLVVAGGE